MTVKASQIFVNLPVRDLNKSITFFDEIGFDFNLQFTDNNAACLVIGENIFAMLLVEEFFRGFTKKEMADPNKANEAIIALTVESREKVDELVERVMAAGGKAYGESMDHEFMYARNFQDLDGHHWEVLYMDIDRIEQN